MSLKFLLTVFIIQIIISIVPAYRTFFAKTKHFRKPFTIWLSIHFLLSLYLIGMISAY
jgi:hypothetical protein